MKRITTTLLCLFTLNSVASAAKLKPLKHPTDARFKKVTQLFSSFATSDLWQGDGVEETYLAKIISKKPEESLRNTVLQVIYWTRARLDSSRWTIPENTSIKKARKSIKGIEEAAHYAVSQDLNEDGEISEQAKSDLAKAIRSAVSKRANFELYLGNHENTLGSCSFAAIVDKKNGEIAVLNSCFSE